MFIPPSSAITKNKGIFRLNVPEFDAQKCTGCMECSLACPDGAMPNAVHDLTDILSTAIKQVNLPMGIQEQLSRMVPQISDEVRHIYRQVGKGDAPLLHQAVTQAVDALPQTEQVLQQPLAALCVVVENLPMSKTKPFFDAMEKHRPGSGGLFSVAVDSTKCSGCMECVEVCGPNALKKTVQTNELTQKMKYQFEFINKMEKTPIRFIDGAIESAQEAKRILLDRDHYNAMGSGHGACRGCGEVTVLRLVSSINRAIKQNSYQAHSQQLETLIDKLNSKLSQQDLVNSDPTRAARITQTLAQLEKRLYEFEFGPTGEGRANAMIANATGCSSVYASTFPANPYQEPWINSLFQDTPALAKGIFEGEMANQLVQIRALHTAQLEVEDLYQPEAHDNQLRYLDWTQLSDKELSLMPAILSIGGDGAVYDIGFGALSRVLSTRTPMKILVLNTGSYSNTGGQASTASFTAQDSDLSRFGKVHSGKQEERKELGLIATFHPKVFVAQSTTALQGHFMSSVIEYLNYQDSPALLDVYTPCMGEHGIADDMSTKHARLALESRMSPVFVHDPRQGETLTERFSIEGNPELTQDWTSQTISFVDQDGMTQLKECSFTPADFALYEGRFAKHFKVATEQQSLISVPEYLAMSDSDRYSHTPFIWATNKKNQLIQLTVSESIIALCEERLKNWHMLQYLSGQENIAMERGYQQQITDLEQRYQASQADKEQTIDDIANGLAELALTSDVFAGGDFVSSSHNIPVKQVESSVTTSSAPISTDTQPLVNIAEENISQCTDCKTCYQQLGELFEKVTIVDDGQPKVVSKVIENALSTVSITPELIDRAERIADECDAEIIEFCAPKVTEA
ncbi:4Fe-4S binding protein [Vibrio sp. SS-MA-C1-2]|nr:4Fe-4S binding protein [Vibrio sp. SS-MA-C1-2]